MPTVRIRSYNAIAAKAAGKSLTITDRIIMLRSNLTHTEIQFSDRYGELSFSFTLADKANGARFKKIGYAHPERWETIQWQVTDEEEDLMIAKAMVMADVWKFSPLQGENHWRYDTRGLLTFALRESGSFWTNTIRRTLWFWTAAIKPHILKAWCSEGVCSIIKQVEPHFWLDPEKTCPELLDTDFRRYLYEKTGRMC